MSKLFELYDLRVTVEAIEGRSVCSMAVGDYFELTHSNRLCIPEGKHFCVYALSAVLPLLAALVITGVRAYTGSTRAAFMVHAGIGLFAVLKVLVLAG